VTQLCGASVKKSLQELLALPTPRGEQGASPSREEREENLPVAVWYDEVVWQRKAIRHGGSFLKHIIPAVVKPMHALWNEVIGFFFLCFALFFGIRTYTYFRSSNGDLMRVVMTGFFVLVFACFGISSFRRARKISRS
jgi:hypothetical protein